MKKLVMILLVVSLIAVFIWVRYVKKTPETQTLNTQVEKTIVTNGEDLNKELMTTEDDGGAADFVELQSSAEGL